MTQLTLPGRTRPYLMAHRGNRVLCPENTLSAFKQAFADGADILETDLHLSADGVFMCIHDATVDRTTDCSGPVREKTLAELKNLSASYGFPGYEGERITLSETIKAIPPDAALALELKTDSFLEPVVCQRLITELEQQGILPRTVMLSFSLPRLQAVQAIQPSVPIGWITMSRLTPSPHAEVLGPFWPAVFFNPTFVARAHKRNQIVCPLDPTPDSRLWYYKWLYCDAIVTDNPRATLQALKRISYK